MKMEQTIDPPASEQARSLIRDGGMRLHIEVKIPVAEMRLWHPGRIMQFFRGVAQIVRAVQDTYERAS